MTNIRFSIIIPTRERADTLKYTLRTCLAQKFDSFEIVVSDNCSSPETKRVVDACASDKIRYVRSNIPLAMSDNWELGVSHAKGEYIIVLGDDDGLLRHALKDIDNLLQELGTKILRWNRVYYHWPNSDDAENRLVIRLGSPSEFIKSADIIYKTGNALADYTRLPMLYTAAIHRDLIAQLKEKCGRVFTTESPDISSGFNFAALVKKYPSVGRPMSINALSAASNGHANIGLRGNSPIAQEFLTLNNQAQFIRHSKVPNVYAVTAFLANSFLQNKDTFFANDKTMQLDRKRLVQNCLVECQRDFGNEKTREAVLSAIRQSLEDDQKLTNWFDALIAKSDLTPPQPVMGAREKGIFGETYLLDASDFGIVNVDDVAQFYEGLTNHTTAGYCWPELKIEQEIIRRIRTAARILIRGKAFSLNE